jgi:hypothetical protein
LTHDLQTLNAHVACLEQELVDTKALLEQSQSEIHHLSNQQHSYQQQPVGLDTLLNGVQEQHPNREQEQEQEQEQRQHEGTYRHPALRLPSPTMTKAHSSTDTFLLVSPPASDRPQLSHENVSVTTTSNLEGIAMPTKTPSNSNFMLVNEVRTLRA